MSESTPAPAPSPPQAAAAGAADPTQVPAGFTPEQWESMMAQFSKQQGVAGFPGTMPFSMPFGVQPFMFGSYMLPGLMPGFLPGGEAKAEGEGSGEDETEDEDDEEDGENGDSSGKEGGRPKRKRAARSSAKKKAATGDGVVKSNSNAALAMLAGAAATNKQGVPQNQAAAAAAAAAMQQNLGELWGNLATSAAMPGATSQLDLSKLSTEQQQQLLATGALEGIADEREQKRLRRKQSNRESARRSRLRKQAECEQLAQKVKEMGVENARLKEEKVQLLAQIDILTAKLQMSAFGAVHALGAQGGDLTKMQADMQAKQAADMHNMAAAMAQAMQVNGGAMLGLPTLDPKMLEGGDEAAAAAAANAAAAAAGAVPTAVDGTDEQQEQEAPPQ